MTDAPATPLTELLRETAIGCDHMNEFGLRDMCNEAADTISELLGALEEALGLRLVGTNNPNIGDDQILPVDVTMGELRRARAAIAKARGDT